MEVSKHYNDTQWSTDFCTSCRRLFPGCINSGELIDVHLPQNPEQKACTLCQFLGMLLSPQLDFQFVGGCAGWLDYGFPWCTSRYQLAIERILGSEHRPVSFFRPIKDGGNLCKYLHILPDNVFRRLNKIQPTIDYKQIATWLNECSKRHGSQCYGQKLGELEDLHMKTIDCRTLAVVPAVVGESYATLSYVWGQSTAATQSIKNTSSALQLEPPATIKDAIKVCLELGFRYLWVDKFCISQARPEETRRQVQKMDAIYRGSSLNIIDGSGVNPDQGLPGVSRIRSVFPSVTIAQDQHLVALPSIEDLGESAWFFRGWTYQEALVSNRQLVFTDQQVYLHCRKGFKMEPYMSRSPTMF